MDIKILNLIKKTGDKTILNDISAEFKPGMNVIIGPNGAGKTTLLKIIASIYQPSAGEIFYDGKPISSMGSDERLSLRRKMGFTFQGDENVFFSGADIMENLIFPLKMRNQEIDLLKINELLKLCGLAGIELTRKTSTLSGGQKKRLQLARALITNPGCLLTDEPTENADPVSAGIIMEKILSDEARRGATVILTTHNLSQARKLGGQIFILSKGKLIQSGPADEVFSKSSPVSLEAADYTFTENIFEGRLSETSEGKIIFETTGKEIAIETAAPYVLSEYKKFISGNVYATIRSEDIFISKEPIISSARNSLKAAIQEITPAGSVWQIKATVNGLAFETLVTKQSVETLNLKKDAAIYLTFKATAVHIIKD